MEQDPSTALSAATEFLSAIWRRDYDQVAAWLHPADLDDFHKTAVLQLASGFMRRDLVREAGSHTGCILPAQAADAVARGQYAGERVRSLPGQPSLGSLGTMPSAAFFARALEANLADRPAVPPGEVSPFAVLGAVPEGADLIHVLYKQGLPEDVPMARDEAVQRLELTRVEDAWRIRLDRRLRFLATPQPSERSVQNE